MNEKVCSLLMLVGVRKEVKRMPLLEKTLKEICYNPLHDGSLGGPLKLWRAVKERGFQNVSLKSVKQWLLRQDPYTLHAPARKRFQRNVMRVRGIDENWQADLVDVQNLKKYNDGYRYLLTCIDVLSKYAWVVPLKNKTPTHFFFSDFKIFDIYIKKKKERKKWVGHWPTWFRRQCSMDSLSNRPPKGTYIESW